MQNLNFDPNDISHKTIETIFLQQVKLLTMRSQTRNKRKRPTPRILEELSIKYL